MGYDTNEEAPAVAGAAAGERDGAAGEGERREWRLLRLSLSSRLRSEWLRGGVRERERERDDRLLLPLDVCEREVFVVVVSAWALALLEAEPVEREAAASGGAALADGFSPRCRASRFFLCRSESEICFCRVSRS